MFTGIIEATGTIEDTRKNGTNTTFIIKSTLSPELQPDQSLAHNGVCLTVEACNESTYQVTAIDETLKKSNIGDLNKGNNINLERSLTLQKRIDGHIVQGHVDAVSDCLNKKSEEGSYVFTFSLPEEWRNLLVEKGSIAVNGVSLTVFDVLQDRFSVAIIPYTYDHTNFNELKEGSRVNLEFDIIGKYISKMAGNYV